MSSNRKRYVIGVLLSCLPLVAAGCGSYKGGDTDSTTTIAGKAQKGPIKKGKVYVHKIDALGRMEQTALNANQPGTTNDDGTFSVTLPKTSGAVMVIIKDGAYIDEKTQVSTSNTTTRAPIPDVEKTPTVAVTDLTEIAVKMVETNHNGELTKEKIEAGLAETKMALNLPAALDLLHTLPSDRNTISAATTQDQIAYQMALGMVSHLANAGYSLDQIVTSYADAAKNTTTLDATLVNAIKTATADYANQVMGEVQALTAISTADIQTMLANVTTVQTSITIITPTIVTIPDTSDTTPPTAPANLAMTYSAANLVRLTWNASTQAGRNVLQGYRIYRNGALIGTAPSNSYSDLTVSAGTSYSYVVKAFNSIGIESDPGNTLSVTTPAPDSSLTITAGGQVKTK